VSSRWFRSPRDWHKWRQAGRRGKWDKDSPSG